MTSYEVTAETPCNLCGDRIGRDTDAVRYWWGGDGHAYHIPCRDAMRIGELEAEVQRLNGRIETLRDTADRATARADEAKAEAQRMQKALGYYAALDSNENEVAREALMGADGYCAQCGAPSEAVWCIPCLEKPCLTGTPPQKQPTEQSAG